MQGGRERERKVRCETKKKKEKKKKKKTKKKATAGEGKRRRRVLWLTEEMRILLIASNVVFSFFLSFSLISRLHARGESEETQVCAEMYRTTTRISTLVSQATGVRYA